MEHLILFDFEFEMDIVAFAKLIIEFNKNGVPYKVERQERSTFVNLRWSDGY
jgi:hypothetical protein